MAKPFKIFLAAVTALVALIVIAAVAIPLLFDPNDYREQIHAAGKKAIGRDLQIGDIQLSVFPRLRVRLRDVEVSDAPGFGNEPFAQLKEVAVGIKVLPLLLDRRVEASGLMLEGLQLQLALDSNGRNNWDDLFQNNADATATVPPPNAGGGAQPAGDFRIEEVVVEGISVKHAAIAYDDLQNQSSYRLNDLNLETGAISGTEPFDIKASAQAHASKPKLDAEIKLKARAVPDRKRKHFDIEDLQIDVLAQGEDKLAVAASLEAALAATPDTGAYTLDEAVIKASIDGTRIPGGKHEAKLQTSATFDQRAGSLTTGKTTLEIAGVRLLTQITAQGIGSDHPRFSGPIDVESFDPRSLLEKFGVASIDTADDDVLKTMSLSTAYQGGLNDASFDKLALTLDDTHLSGRVAVNDFATAAVQFALKADQFNADRYLPPVPEVSEPNAGQAPPSNIDELEFPFEAVEALNVEGTLEIGQLTLKQLQMQQVRLRLAGAADAAKQAQFDAQLYRGSITAKSRIAPGAPGTLSLNTLIDSVSLGPMLRDLTGEATIRGTGDIRFDGSTSGTTVGDMKRRLKGDLALTFLDGAIKGFNLGQILRQAQAAFSGASVQDDEPQETDFAEINLTARIAEGIARSDYLDAKSPLFRASGEGSFDLINETMDYLAKPTIVASKKGQGGKGLEELRGLTVPVRFRGSWADPKISVQLDRALKQKATQRLREELGSDDELEQKLNRELGNALDSLFGNDSGEKKKKKRETQDGSDG